MPHRKNQTASQRQDAIYRFLEDFAADHGYPPSVREIGDAVGLKSSSTVHAYLRMLERRGLIHRDPTKPRAIDLLDKKPWSRSVPVPLVGTVAAGVPILAEENIEDTYTFPESLIGSNGNQIFMLRVQGDSMIKIGMLDGDYVLVQQQDTIRNGDVGVALVNEESATVKRIYKEKNGWRLQPENDDMEPFFEKQVRILGKVVGVYRCM